MAEEIASSTGNETSNLAKHKDSGGGVSAFQKPTLIKRGFCTHTNINGVELQNNNNTNALDKKLSGSFKCTPSTEPENGFLSTLDSLSNESAISSDSSWPPPICVCTNPANCVTLKNILDSFKAPLSEEQAWAIIYQTIKLYRVTAVNCKQNGKLRIFSDLETPESLINLNMHRDGTVHCSWSSTEIKEKQQKLREEKNLLLDLDSRDYDNHVLVMASQKKILRKVGVIIYTALDYNLQADEQCQMSQELEELITYMTADESADDDCIDEGIDEGYKRWDDENDDDKCNETKELDYVLKVCSNHVKPTVPDDHYKAVCRALVTETIELRIFLQQVLNDDTENLRLKADSQTSKQELAKLGFNDWARFWVQVIDELRRGVRLKKNNYSRAPIEYELTPYEILMEDIRSKKYQLRKVMVNGDIPPRVKKDAHAVILEFIRSRPPLKKASERKLPPPLKRTPSPREQLMDSIRKGQTLKHIQPPSQPRLRYRLLPPTSTTSLASSDTRCHTIGSLRIQKDYEAHTAPRSKQRLIKVDFSLLQDDDNFFDDPIGTLNSTSSNIGICSQPKMPPYPIGGYMMVNDPRTAAQSTVLTMRRTTYDLATQCESRRASLRRHTIVGCQSNFDETHSMPPSRPDSRQSEVTSSAAVIDGVVVPTLKKPQHNNNVCQQQPQQEITRSQSPSESNVSVDGCVGGGSSSSNCSRSSSSIGPWNKSFLDEKTWHERGDDRLSLTLEEIVHIRSVMTKAELESLPVGVRVKEDVEKRKVCFLCLRTRFSIFGPWGIQCKLCQRTVCSKCYTKMRIPVEHFRNVPLVLISPSLLSSPAGSNTPSPSHHAQHTHSSSTGNILDETFPKSLIERLLRSESERKTRNTVGSAPSSPKHQRSNMSTPGIVAPFAAGQAVEAINDTSMMTSSNSTSTNGVAVVVAGSSNSINVNGGYNNKENAQLVGLSTKATNKHISIMSRSMEGPRSLPVHSPARPHSNSSTLDRKSKFSRAFTLSPSGSQLSQDQKENVRGEIVPVCHDCKGLVMEITRSSKQTRSFARNRALQNLTLDLSPVYK